MRIMEEKETINGPCVDISSTGSRSLIQAIVGVGGQPQSMSSLTRTYVPRRRRIHPSPREVARSNKSHLRGKEKKGGIRYCSYQVGIEKHKVGCPRVRKGLQI
jgi:hypothetical protein